MWLRNCIIKWSTGKFLKNSYTYIYFHICIFILCYIYVYVFLFRNILLYINNSYAQRLNCLKLTIKPDSCQNTLCTLEISKWLSTYLNSNSVIYVRIWFLFLCFVFVLFKAIQTYLWIGSIVELKVSLEFNYTNAGESERNQLKQFSWEILVTAARSTGAMSELFKQINQIQWNKIISKHTNNNKHV